VQEGSAKTNGAPSTRLLPECFHSFGVYPRVRSAVPCGPLGRRSKNRRRQQTIEPIFAQVLLAKLRYPVRLLRPAVAFRYA
jgi:hypothetical protein